MSRPTIYLAGWASRRTAGHFGPGRAFTMMLRPNGAYGQRGEGRVPALTYPDTPEWRDMLAAALEERKAATGRAAAGRLRSAFEALMASAKRMHPPGRLTAVVWSNGMGGGLCTTIFDGDTVACGCSVPHSRQGACHRAWAAPFLHRAGWNVVLDGRPFASAGPA